MKGKIKKLSMPCNYIIFAALSQQKIAVFSKDMVFENCVKVLFYFLFFKISPLEFPTQLELPEKLYPAHVMVKNSNGPQYCKTKTTCYYYDNKNKPLFDCFISSQIFATCFSEVV